MKQKGIPEMDDVEEIISKISEESPYKRRPTQKRTWMTVPEMGKLLGLKKTDRYWLVHKNVFESTLFKEATSLTLRQGCRPADTDTVQSQFPSAPKWSLGSA